MLRALAAVLVLAAAWPGPAAADDATGLVVDQSGSIVPAAAVTLVRGETVVGETRTGSDGSFVLAGPLPGDVVVVALQGFETVRVAAGRDLRIVLLHYAPIQATVEGEPEGIHVMLGSDRLATPIAELRSVGR